jgi:hypothetical protein
VQSKAVIYINVSQTVIGVPLRVRDMSGGYVNETEMSVNFFYTFCVTISTTASLFPTGNFFQTNGKVKSEAIPVTGREGS